VLAQRWACWETRRAVIVSWDTRWRQHFGLVTPLDCAASTQPMARTAHGVRFAGPVGRAGALGAACPGVGTDLRTHRCRAAPHSGEEHLYRLIGDAGKKNGAWLYLCLCARRNVVLLGDQPAGGTCFDSMAAVVNRRREEIAPSHTLLSRVAAT
jgi:hypothetical protein